MKYLFILLLALCLASCTAQKSSIFIPANQTVEIDYIDIDYYQITLKNKGIKDISIAVNSRSSNEQVKGFGMGDRAKVEVYVEAENKLLVTNNSDQGGMLSYWIAEKNRLVEERRGEYVSFTLRNTSAKSIPLIIPTVMNPNLSPFSKSGVDLKIGQEIFFKAKGKRHVLLIVDSTINNGDELDVAKLLKKRKKELGL